MQLVTQLTLYLRRLITQPVGELSRAQRFLRYMLDLTRHCAHQLREDRAEQMAAALTYRTIFSLIPLVVISMVAFSLFGDMDSAGSQLRTQVYKFFNLTSIQTTGDSGELRMQLDSILNDAASKVEGISFQSIGAVGALLLIWAALGLLVTVEQSANLIFNAPKGRPWHIRIMIYWAVITLGPLLLFFSLYVAGRIISFAEVVPVLGTLLALLGRFSALAASWLMLFLLYALMPNTQVRLRAALIGSFVAAVLWETGKWGFGLYVRHAVPYSKLYGTLGLVPLFLFWLYLTWVFVLFGLELTYTLQTLKGRRLQQRDLEVQKSVLQSSDPQWLIPIMTQIGKCFVAGQPIGRQDLADELNLPVRSIAELGEKLEEAGLVYQVHRHEEEELGLSLAKPPEQIRIAALIELGRSLTIGPDRQHKSAGWSYLDTLTQAELQAAGNTTLASLLNGEINDDRV